MAGDIADYIFRGTIGVDAANIAPFSELAGRQLAGALDLDADGELRPLAGGFDLTLDGTAVGLQIGNRAADNVLEGETRITGRVARGETGLVADKLRIVNSQVELLADGTFATGTADFDFDLALADLALLSERASGRLTAKGRAAGTDGLIGLTFGAEVAEGTLAGKSLSDGTIGFEGTLQQNDLNGQIMGSALLDQVKVSFGFGDRGHRKRTPSQRSRICRGRNPHYGQRHAKSRRPVRRQTVPELDRYIDRRGIDSSRRQRRRPG